MPPLRSGVWSIVGDAFAAIWIVMRLLQMDIGGFFFCCYDKDLRRKGILSLGKHLRLSFRGTAQRFAIFFTFAAKVCDATDNQS